MVCQQKYKTAGEKYCKRCNVSAREDAQKKRGQQNLFWLEESIDNRLQKLFYDHPHVKKQFKAIQSEVIEGILSPSAGVNQLFKLFMQK